MLVPHPECEDMTEPGGWNDRIIAEFRANHGQVGGGFAGAPLLLLHTTGARTGMPRVSLRAGLRYETERSGSYRSQPTGLDPRRSRSAALSLAARPARR